MGLLSIRSDRAPMNPNCCRREERLLCSCQAVSLSLCLLWDPGGSAEGKVLIEGVEIDNVTIPQGEDGDKGQWFETITGEV